MRIIIGLVLALVISVPVTGVPGDDELRTAWEARHLGWMTPCREVMGDVAVYFQSPDPYVEIMLEMLDEVHVTCVDREREVGAYYSVYSDELPNSHRLAQYEANWFADDMDRALSYLAYGLEKHSAYNIGAGIDALIEANQHIDNMNYLIKRFEYNAINH